MKNHYRHNGKLLQTNKTWSQLKATQKEMISHHLRGAYMQKINDTGKRPTKSECEDILAHTMQMIEEKEIWIPEKEVRQFFSSRKLRWQKQSQANNEKAASAE